jgi:enediyne biosynthesis protein E4
MMNMLNSNLVQKVAGGALLLGLVALTLALSRTTDSRDAANSAQGGDPQSSTGALPPSQALERYGFTLEEVSKASGINFVHEAPRLDRRLDHIMPQVAAMGAAVAVGDFDRDGWADIYATSSAEDVANRLYRNMGDGSFEDVAAAMGVADLNIAGTGASMGAVWGDYDNDGYEDLFVYKWGRPVLFHNDGGVGFTEVSTQTDLPEWANIGTAIWFDFDQDGFLDLFAGGYFHEDIDLWNLESTAMMPESFEYAQNGGRNYLLHNQGDGTFRDVTEEMGVQSRRWALAAGAADVRGVGYPDLMVANDYGASEYYLNENGRRFREVGREAGVGGQPKSGMNVSFGDVFNSGQLAIYETNISEEGLLLQGNNLFVPRAPANQGDVPKFDNMAGALRVELGGWSFGAQFGDLNNDSFIDLFLTNGYISADESRTYWYDFSKVAGGHTSIISDAKNWPPMEGRSLAGFQQKRVWVNDGSGSFVDVAPLVGVTEKYDGRAVALADLWNRGVLDVVVAHQRGPLLVYKNEVSPERRWIQFQFEPAESNGSAIGAQVRVFSANHQQLQELDGGSGFSAQNHRRLHFGLGTSAIVERVEVRWPSGATEVLIAPELNTLHTLKETSNEGEGQ